MLPLWNRHLSLYALAGPALAFSRKCDVSRHAVTGPSSSRSAYFDQCELPLGPDSRIQLNGGSDFGFIGGLGVDFSFWDMGLSAEVLYTLGLGSDGTEKGHIRSQLEPGAVAGRPGKAGRAHQC